MVQSIIQKTRIGYSYQDKYCLWKILTFLSQGRLKSAFVDFPIPNTKLSIDLKLDFLDVDTVMLYEIKTGDAFVNKIVSEFKEIFKVFRAFSLNSPELDNVENNIVLAADINHKVLEVWRDIEYLRTTTRNPMNQIVYDKTKSDCYIKYNIQALEYSEDEFIQLVKSLNFESSKNKGKISPIDILSEIEDGIESLIKDFANKLGLNGMQYLIPDSLIMKDLLYCLKECADNNQNCVPSLRDCLVGAFSRRLFIMNRMEVSRGAVPESYIKDCEGEISLKLTNIVNSASPQALSNPVVKI